MIILKLEELEQKGIALKGKSTMLFKNKPYRRETAVSKKFQNTIAEIAEKYNVDGLNILLVEHKLYFTVWRETKPLDESKKNLDNFVNQRLKDLGM